MIPHLDIVSPHPFVRASWHLCRRCIAAIMSASSSSILLACMLLQGRDWLGLVAVHSDAWLIGLAFYKGARLNKEQR